MVTVPLLVTQPPSALLSPLPFLPSSAPLPFEKKVLLKGKYVNKALLLIILELFGVGLGSSTNT